MIPTCWIMLASILLCLGLVTANAFKGPFQGNNFFKGLKLAISSITSESKYSSRDSANFVNDIERIIADGPIPVSERQFLINGWRWHTSSALRDLQRYTAVLEHVENGYSSHAENTSNKSDGITNYKDRVDACYKFVCGYNLKGLMKIESELFFPWLKEMLPPAAIPLMSELTQEQSDAKILSSQIGQLCVELSGRIDDDLSAIRQINSKLKAIRKSYLKIQSVQETVFVPYIKAFIPKKEQERFNRKVIATLGMLQAQVHLVGMVEAIKDQPHEMSMLRSQIPSLAQATLSIWKKRLYDPKTACLKL